MLNRKTLKPGTHASIFSLAGLTLAALMAGGCGGDRKITFVQDDYINTGVHCDRARAEERTGEPLDVSIVCVTPADMKKQVDGVNVNHNLRAASGLTSADWYERCPISGRPEESKSRFAISPEQIYVLTNDTNQARLFGTRVGPALNGAKIDGQAKTIETPIVFKGSQSSDDSIIYVFAKFKDRNGRVLPAPPVKFQPPSRYKGDLRVRIGVRKGEECSGPLLGQYIEIAGDSRN